MGEHGHGYRFNDACAVFHHRQSHIIASIKCVFSLIYHAAAVRSLMSNHELGI